MRGKSIVLIIIALGCGLVASIGISQIMDKKPADSSPKMKMGKIYVAIVDVDINEPLNAEMVKLEEWPQDKIPEGAISKIEDIEERAPLQRLFSGEPILARKLVDPLKRQGATLRIPKGYRVIPVKVTTDSGGAGLLLPGDRVDVLAYLKASSTVGTTRALTILKDIRIFAVNANIDRYTDEDGKALNAKTVSLILKPQQVEKVLLAVRLGSISLSMRRPDDDTQEDKWDATTVRDLVSGSDNDSRGTAQPLATTVPATSSLLDLLQQGTQDRQQTTAQPSQVARARWSTEIISPNGIVRHEFNETGGLVDAASGNDTGTTRLEDVPPRPVDESALLDATEEEKTEEEEPPRAEAPE